MKNIILIGAMCAMAISSYGQLKVHSNGNISLKNNSSQAFSPLSLNSSGDSTYFAYYSGNKDGLYVLSEDVSGVSNCARAGYFTSTGAASKIRVGLTGTGTATNSSETGIRAVGVQGNASNSGSGYSIGLLGVLTGSGNGAAIFGTTSNTLTPDSRYAGLFKGNTKVQGDLIVTGTIQGTLLSNLPDISTTTARSLSATENESISKLISDVAALAYTQAEFNRDTAQNELETDLLNFDTSFKSGYATANNAITSEKDFLGEQYQAKQHYTLDVEQLERVFPDLVYNKEDGSKSINYMEMIPLLVQSINELNARIVELESNGNVKAATRATTGTSSFKAVSALPRAVLYQNTPNPFTAQTEIRFSLPDDAPASYIYIFDMTGKMQKQIPVDPSMQSVTINGYELQPGIYLYSLVVGGLEIDTKRMILSK